MIESSCAHKHLPEFDSATLLGLCVSGMINTPYGSSLANTVTLDVSLFVSPNEPFKYTINHGICFVCNCLVCFNQVLLYFQLYRNNVWMWQRAESSLLEYCFTEICSRHMT